MDLKHLAFDLELKADDDTRTVEGYASVFNNLDNDYDIVLPGAFLKSLKKKSSVPMLWQHDRGQPVGVWDEMEEREKGLFVKGTILDTALGTDAYKLVKAGAVKGMSIGYSPKKYEIDQKTGVRQLKELDLFEVSLVTFPMNEKAQITRVKSDGQFMTEREFEEFLRDVGQLSHKEAKIVVSEGYRAIPRQRDAEAEELNALATLFNQLKL